MGQLSQRSVTIASAGTISTTFELNFSTRGSFQLPTMTGTAITVKVSNDDVTYTNCPVEGSETNAITTASAGTYALPVKCFNFRYLKLVSGSAEGADRVIEIVTRD